MKNNSLLWPNPIYQLHPNLPSKNVLPTKWHKDFLLESEKKLLKLLNIMKCLFRVKSKSIISWWKPITNWRSKTVNLWLKIFWRVRWSWLKKRIRHPKHRIYRKLLIESTIAKELKNWRTKWFSATRKLTFWTVRWATWLWNWESTRKGSRQQE